jgi:pRiA4b ORF-3-like protein
MQIFQFKVSLDHIEPPVWRRFVISSDATFGKLSDVIQIVMGWNNSHLHEFFLGVEQIGMKDEDSPAEVKNENRIRLSSKLKTEEFHFRYLYDFGDDWEHSIVLERILASNDESPRCLAGKRNCPPEDSGGPHQYMEFLAVRKNPKHPRQKEMSELLAWFDPQFDPERFNLKEVNLLLTT